MQIYLMKKNIGLYIGLHAIHIYQFPRNRYDFVVV